MLLKKVNKRKRHIGIRPLFKCLDGILRRMTNIAANIKRYTATLFIRKRQTIKMIYEMIFSSGDNDYLSFATL